MYEIQSFLILSLVSAVLPWKKRYGIEGFLLLVLLFPIGNFLAAYFYKGGLYFFDFYFISLLFRLIVNQKIEGAIALFACVGLSFYALWDLFQSQYLDKYFLRDFRLIIHLFYIISLLTIFKRITISPSFIKMAAIVASSNCLIYSQLIGNGIIFTGEDQFYIDNSYRYLSIATYFCFGFVAFNSFLPIQAKHGYLGFFTLTLCIVSVALSGMRMLLVVSICAYLLGRKGVTSRVIFLFFIAIAFFVFQFLQVQSGQGSLLVERLLDLDVSTIAYGLSTRFYPALELISNFGPVNFFLGGGFGTVYEIPWFDYRDSKDNLNNFVDNTYLTLFGKFGLLSILLLLALLFSYRRILGAANFSLFISVGFTFSMLWLVYAVPYQMTAIGLLLAMGFIGACKNPVLSVSK